MQVTLGANRVPNPASRRVPSPDVHEPFRQPLAERVYHEHGAALRRLACGCIRRYGIGDRVAPDDLVGRAFLIVIRDPRHLQRLTLPSIAAYMSKIVQHEAIMTLRKKRADARAFREKGEQLRQAVQNPDPTRSAEWAEQLWWAYEQLNAEERTLCTYRRAGYSWSDIAEIMDRTPAYLKKRLERARSRIAEVVWR